MLAVVFATSRLPALQVQAVDTDINLYARYAAESQAANSKGQSFYDLHRQRVEGEIRGSSSPQAAALAPYKSVEYPPLAVTFMTIPAWLTDKPFEEEFPTGLQPRYTRSYVWLMAFFDAVVLLIVVFLVRRLYGAESVYCQVERCLVYVVGTWPLYGVLYTRLDLGVAVLVIAALALLVCRVHWSMSLAVLAVAIHFKLMPAVLAPLWIVASLPVTALRGSVGAVLRQMALRVGVLVAFGLAILAPYYVRHGAAVLEFLGYHKNRGIEIESTWASLLIISRAWGVDVGVYHSHGSVNVQSPWADFLAGLATPVMALLIAAGTVLFATAVRRRQGEGEGEGEPGPAGMTIAQRWPRLVAMFALLLLLISIAANKVFSPQYLLWVLPLAPLVDFHPRARRLFFGAILAMCYLTMRIFPDCFVGEIVYVISHDGPDAIFGGPTAFGTFLLLVRNGLCVAITMAIGARCFRSTGWRVAVPSRGRAPLRLAFRVTATDHCWSSRARSKRNVKYRLLRARLLRLR